MTAEDLRIEAAAAKRKVDSGEAIFLDVVQPDSWSQLPDAIAGAVRIPPSEIAERIRELPADREIIAYCT